MPYAFDAYVTAALFSKSGQGIFALGDGTVRFDTGEVIEAHDGAVLCACLHPSGEGVVTGGDDGRLVWSRTSGPQEIAEIKGRWIDAVTASPESGLIAFAAGKIVHVRDAADSDFARTFEHEASALGLAFDPKGRRLAVAVYGGARLWFARIAEQKPTVLAWAGSHIALAWSPDGKFLMSSMQENQLHGWRVADEKNMRMGGYPAKVKSLVFMSKGQFLATSGAQGVVIWPFGGSAGPMGKEAAEVGYDASTLVAQVAGTATGRRVAAGLEDGRVWVCDLEGQKIEMLKAEKGSAITALAISADGRRVAWGDEDGAAGIAEAP
ncbi:MAG: WD40 repeat domain-containing protein [Phenylobacterium sp.]|uniref:WD40 repeat domain-containing protein n=1 Tax=Phenylobacterium sp. TaxID=1871053 RepID=UPI002726CF4B|nr:WD40 repeat domain-containing protein [Phenylobacterium sp.]MDO8899761.1 WD40 repeat domain-containing protein [Phenylobacterium sp.]